MASKRKATKAKSVAKRGRPPKAKTSKPRSPRMVEQPMGPDELREPMSAGNVEPKTRTGPPPKPGSPEMLAAQAKAQRMRDNGAKESDIRAYMRNTFGIKGKL